MLTGASERRVAARIGKAAFLAPDMRSSPERRAPPVIVSLSIQVALESPGGSVMGKSLTSLNCKMAYFIKTAEFSQIEQLLRKIFEAQVYSFATGIFYPFNH